MPDAQITIEKVWTSEGEGNYGPYTKYDVQPAEDKKERYVTFKDDLGLKAQASVGRKVLATFEAPQDGKRPKLTALSDPLDDSVAATPALGTGEYIKGKANPDDDRAYNARRALQDAVNFYNGTPNLAAEHVLGTAALFFDWLMSKSQAAVPEKPSGDATEAPATEGQIKEIAELLVVLEKAQPASPDPTWTWTNEAQKYCSANFEKNSLVALTKAEANQLREYLEERIAAVQAEAGIPF